MLKSNHFWIHYYTVAGQLLILEWWLNFNDLKREDHCFVIRGSGVQVTQPAPFSPNQNGNKALVVVTNLFLVGLGISLLIFGGNMTIVHGSAVAKILNVSDVAIGMFVVAVGTSLPELATSAIAAYKKETDLALGNIVGSNIFNTLMVLPAAAIISPLPIPRGGDLDLGVAFVFVLVVIPLFVFSNARLGRTAGAGLVLAYFAYMVYRVTQ